MEPQDALLILEMELIDEAECTADKLGYYAGVVISAATLPQGYSGLAWVGGAKLLDVARRLGQDPNQLFDLFGWQALANGIRTSLQNKRILEGLSYATVPFLPPVGSVSIFEHPQVVKAIQDGLITTPQPFVKPADLGAVREDVQFQFGELLGRLVDMNADSELCLQWSACALRVLPPQSACYEVAAISLVRSLCRAGRFGVAYYAFRALAEQTESLWDGPMALGILRSFIEQYWQDEQTGYEVLAQLCVDEDVLRQCRKHSDLFVILGALSINLTKRHSDGHTEATAWSFVSDMLDVSALVAHTFGSYLTESSLPPLPVSKAEHRRILQGELDAVLESVEEELHPRKFKKLASKVYQLNVQEVFAPLLDQIRAGSCPPQLVAHIQELDPEKLIADAERRVPSPDEIGRRVLYKMAEDNRRILKKLESAAQKRIELDLASRERIDSSLGEFDLYEEFNLVLENLGESARWALETLLPDLWKRLQEGVAITVREQEARRYAEG